MWGELCTKCKKTKPGLTEKWVPAHSTTKRKTYSRKKKRHRIRTNCGSVRSKNEEVIYLRIKWKPCTVSMLICFILNEICNSLSELKCWNSGNVPAYNIVVHVDNTPFISQWNFFFDWNVMKSKTCLDHPWTPLNTSVGKMVRSHLIYEGIYKIKRNLLVRMDV